MHGMTPGVRAAGDAVHRVLAQHLRGAHADLLLLPQLCQGPLAVCCDCVQAELVGDRPALEEDVVACALVVLQVLLQQARAASQYCVWYSVSTFYKQ